MFSHTLQRTSAKQGGENSSFFVDLIEDKNNSPRHKIGTLEEKDGEDANRGVEAE